MRGLWLAVCFCAAAAQPATARPAPAAAGPCPDGRIAFVLIDAQSIFDVSDPDLERRARWAYRAANALHVRTREAVIRRVLLFDPGDCYDAFLLQETERLLRGYDFLATVDVYGIPQPGGDWHVIVHTRDEWSTRVDVRVRVDNGLAVQGARIYETNLFGTGQTLGAFFYEREVTRDYGLLYGTPQLFGTRLDLSAAAGRTRAGTLLRQQVVYPFRGEVGRWAGRQGFLRDDQFFDYIAGDAAALDAPHVLLPTREKFVDAAVLHRLGERGRMALVGLGLSYHELRYPGIVQVAPGGDFDRREPADSALAAPVLAQRREVDAVRVALLVGHRDVRWRKRRGLDSMRGEQDVRLGREVGLAVGRSLPALHGDDDVVLTLTGYWGFQAFGAFGIARTRADARYDLETAGTGWVDRMLEAELLAYWRRAALPRHTLVLRANAAGLWGMTTPAQLTLGGETMLRGYDVERFPGGRRLVVTLEDRIYLGWPARDLFDAGATVFVDAGRVWPGDTPFGGDSGWRATAGFGIRTSFPAGGRTTYRLDLAWPVAAGTRPGDLRLRFSIGEPIGVAPREGAVQLDRSRPRAVAGRLFDVRD
jgi:hypothetical protein